MSRPERIMRDQEQEKAVGGLGGQHPAATPASAERLAQIKARRAAATPPAPIFDENNELVVPMSHEFAVAHARMVSHAPSDLEWLLGRVVRAENLLSTFRDHAALADSAPELLVADVDEIDAFLSEREARGPIPLQPPPERT